MVEVTGTRCVRRGLRTAALGGACRPDHQRPISGHTDRLRHLTTQPALQRFDEIMNKQSIWAVVAGMLVIIVVTTLVDVVMHAIGVFPPMNQPLSDANALIATSYRIVITVGGALLTAWLAPDKPMKHAM